MIGNRPELVWPSHCTARSRCDSSDSGRVPVPDHLPAPVASSQLIWRALGPLRRHRVRVMIDWVGLAGRPADLSKVVTARHHVSGPTLRSWTLIVEKVGRDLTLPTRLHHDLTRPARPGEDHRSRGRQAQLFGLPKPTPAPLRDVLSARDRGQAVAARRILAALGPLDLVEITAALGQRQRRHDLPPTTTDVQDLLQRSGIAVCGPDGLYRLTDPAGPAAMDAALLAVARGTGTAVYTNRQIDDLLRRAGFTGGLAPTRSYHPLLIHLGRGTWQVRGPHPSAET